MRKNVASQVIGAQMVSATDGSAFTGSVTCYVTGDGGTQAAGSVSSGACAHEGNGFHTYAPAQAETNYDHIGFTFTGTGAIPATVQVYTTFPQTGDSFARIGSNGASLTGIPWNASWDAEVQSECTDALNAYDPPTNAEMTARTLTSASYATASALATVDGIVDDILVDTGTTLPATLTTIDGVVDGIKAVTDNLPDSGALSSLATASALSTVDTVVDAIKVTTDKLDDTLELDSTVYRFTANALEEAPTGGGGGSGATAEEVWEYASRTLTGGDNIVLAKGTGITGFNDLSASAVNAEVDTALADYDGPTNAEMVARTLASADYATASALATVDGVVDAILDDTGTSGVVVSASSVRTAVGMSSANLDTQLGDLPTNSELATALAGADDAVLAAIAGLNNISTSQVKSQVVAALNTDTYGEPTGVPGATATLVNKIGYQYMALRNRVDVTAGKKTFYDDGGSAEWEKDLSDDGTTYSETEANSV